MNESRITLSGTIHKLIDLSMIKQPEQVPIRYIRRG
jgi:hypothetical protein